MPQQRSASGQRDLSGEFILGMFENTARALSLTVEVFLHRGFGPRYVSCGFFGVLLILFTSMWFPPTTAMPLQWFAFTYGFFWLIAVVNVAIRYWRGTDKAHSRYNGYPLLCRLLPSWKETNVKYLEAVCVIFLGCGLTLLSKPLGDYIMVASGFVLIRAYGLASQRRNQAIDLRDTVIEQQMAAEEFRGMRE
jgi:hypothetical protein